MSNKKKLAKITDLFAVGESVHLGNDEEGQAVYVWINKLNSFQESHAHKDGIAGRTGYASKFMDMTSPEYLMVWTQLEELPDESVITYLVDSHYEEAQLLAQDDVHMDPEWRERLDFLRRAPELMDDAKIDEDNEDRKTWEKYNVEYLEAIYAKTDERQEKYKEELESGTRDDMNEKYMNMHKDRNSIEYFVLERNITRLYYCMRDCSAIKSDEGKLNHSKCDHSELLAESRKEILDLPEDVIDKCQRALDRVTVGYRDVENFPVTESSSESSA